MLLKFQETSSSAFWDAKMLWLLQYLAEILSNIFVCHEWLYWGRKNCLESPQYSALRSVWGFFLDSLFISLLALLPFYLLQISSEIVTLSRGWKDNVLGFKRKRSCLPGNHMVLLQNVSCMPSHLPRSFKCGSCYSRKLATLINKQNNYTALLSLLSIQEPVKSEYCVNTGSQQDLWERKQLYYPLKVMTSFKHFVSENFSMSNDNKSCFSFGNHCENIIYWNLLLRNQFEILELLGWFGFLVPSRFVDLFQSLKICSVLICFFSTL